MRAVYPGSFDPVTNGHLDIIERAAKIFDEVIVVVFKNPEKKPRFSPKERVSMLKEVTAHLKNVHVDSSDGLLSDYVRQVNAQVILRALRVASDFDYEFQLALMNKKLQPAVETMFMATTTEWSFLSSSVVKEVADLGACIEGLVPKCVSTRLARKQSKT